MATHLTFIKDTILQSVFYFFHPPSIYKSWWTMFFCGCFFFFFFFTDFCFWCVSFQSFLTVQLFSHLLAPSLVSTPRLRIDRWQIGVELPFSPACHQSLAPLSSPSGADNRQNNSSGLKKEKLLTKIIALHTLCSSSSLFAALTSWLRRKEAVWGREIKSIDLFWPKSTEMAKVQTLNCRLLWS